jgi:hypothetical protein
MLLWDIFDLSQSAPLTGMHTNVVGEPQSQLPLPHTPRSIEMNLKVKNRLYLFIWHIIRKCTMIFKKRSDQVLSN